MSLPAATKTAAHTTQNIITKVRNPPFPSLTFLTFKYEAHPTPINVTTRGITKDLLSDAYHPLHTKAKRKLATFDPAIFHWNVRAPLPISKRVIVRNWAARRVRVAFEQVLKEAGLDREGKGEGGRQGLSGALVIYVGGKEAPIRASGEEVRRECGELLRIVLGMYRRQVVEGEPRRVVGWRSLERDAVT